MKSEDPSHDEHALIVPFHDADRVRRLHKSPPKSPSCDQDFHDVLSLPLREDRVENKVISDDEWRQRSIDNIMALLKANADLRALAVKLSDILAARGGWDRNDLEKAAKVAQPHAKGAQKPRRSGGNP